MRFMAKDSMKRSSSGNGKRAAVEEVKDVQAAIRSGIEAVERGEKESAYNIFRETAELHPDTSEVWVWLGGTSPTLDDAQTAFEKAYALDPDNEQASLGLRWVRLRRKAQLDRIVGAAVPMPGQGSGDWLDAATSPLFEGTLAQSTVKCPNCGKENAATEKFCSECAQDLSAALAGAGTAASSAARKRAISTPALVAIVFAILVIAAVTWWLLMMN